MAEQRINDEMVVVIDYVLRSKTGREIERSQKPVAFIQGYGQVVHGLEAALYGLQAGDETDVVVSPEDGYGAYDEEDLQQVPRSALPENVELTLGKALRFRDRKTGEAYTAHVVGTSDEHVTLDYNHPLAGQELHFSVEIVDVRPATPGELEQGHADASAG